MSSNEMLGGEALARMIKAFHGGPMFGMGGFQLLPFYDPLALEFTQFRLDSARYSLGNFVL